MMMFFFGSTFFKGLQNIAEILVFQSSTLCWKAFVALCGPGSLENFLSSDKGIHPHVVQFFAWHRSASCIFNTQSAQERVQVEFTTITTNGMVLMVVIQSNT